MDASRPKHECESYSHHGWLAIETSSNGDEAVLAFGLLIDHPTQDVLLTLTTFLAILGAVSGGASLVAIPELLSRSIRATGLSIVYAIGVAI